VEIAAAMEPSPAEARDAVGMPPHAAGCGATMECLTDFVMRAATYPDLPSLGRAAVERLVGCLHADAAEVRVGDRILATAGPPAATSADGVARAAAAYQPAPDVAVTGPTPVVAVPLSTPPDAPAGPATPAGPGYVLAARQNGFSPAETELLRGIAGVVDTAAAASARAEAERRRAEDIADRLTTAQRQLALTKCLSAVYRSLALHAPLQEIFDTVTSGARDLLGDDAAGLRLVHADDPDSLLLVSCNGLAPDLASRLWQANVNETGICGLAVIRGEVVAADPYHGGPAIVPELANDGLQAAMAAPVRDNGRVAGALVIGSYRPDRAYSTADREALTALADAVSLALSDAGTLDAMYQAFHDPMTGLASRALFLDRVTHALACASRDGTSSGMLLIGLDRFKTVNDALGHAAGDELLAAAAERIRAVVRAADTAARLEGDQFAVLLHGVTNRNRAVRISRRVIQALRDPFSIMGRQVFVTASVGIAFSDLGGGDPQILLRRAEQALATAKRNGKGRYEVYIEPRNATVRNPVDLEADLRQALDRGQLVLRYQPIVELMSGRINGFEALIRWQHHTYGLIPPLEFIPMAEESDLIVPIGAWVLQEACAQTARWNADRPSDDPLTISVNLSARQLAHSDLPRQVASALNRSGLDPACVTLEITESMLVQGSDASIRRLQRLKDLGVRLAIDDFGTGYSSLAYLRRFPVDIIKIDKMFVDDLPHDHDGATLTRAIVGLGRSMQLSIIAEGIEAENQCDPLRDSGCEFGQGYFFAKPLTVDEVAGLLATPTPTPA
jgi:diguanylate cyclase (GGDEF)-like protein